MTLVFKTGKETLFQVNVGVADVVATLSAANSAYGWVNGLEGTRTILSKIQNAFSNKIESLQLDKNLKLLPVECYVLTGAGPLVCSIQNSHEAFSGDIRTQVIGVTCCALAHEIEVGTAVKLFMECLVPYLFSGTDAVTDSLYNQLNEESHIQRILNEGASRGLTDIFNNAVMAQGLPLGDQEWLKTHLKAEEGSDFPPTELQMVGGLLKWVGSDSGETYYTRSGLAARVATYLKAIGYGIGRIQQWDGSGESPQLLGSKNVLLVIGGSVPTDHLQLEEEVVNEIGYLHHYRYQTTGAMLLSALHYQSSLYPEVLQTHFEEIYTFIESNLDVDYEIKDALGLKVKFSWSSNLPDSGALERRLASFYFPTSAKYISRCYRRIATENMLDKVTSGKSAMAGFETLSEDVALFRAVTAAITFSIVSRLAKSDFKQKSHLTSLDLGAEGWLDELCPILDHALTSDIEYSKAAFALATVHAGQNPEYISNCPYSVIGWRSGTYSVLPGILLDLSLDKNAMEFKCLDRFWGNVIVHEDGSLRSSTSPALLQGDEGLDDIMTGDASSLQMLSRPWFGQPDRGPPDEPLYLSIERPMHYSSRDTAFVARLRGTVVGTVGINNVLRTLLYSLDEPFLCPGHSNPLKVVNCKASAWVANRHSKPVRDGIFTFIPCQKDKLWTIFLAGQSSYFNGRIAFHCVDCCIDKASTSGGVIVGYC
jgi:hypothetical protein